MPADSTAVPEISEEDRRLADAFGEQVHYQVDHYGELVRFTPSSRRISSR